MKGGWQAPLAVLVVVIFFAAFGAKPMQSAADIAAWVQGVGSLLAIIAAIGIYTKQYKDKQADDANETRAFVEAIREEVQAAWDGYNAEIHPALLALPDGQPFNVVYPVSTETFPIYQNGASMVGKIDDPELRRIIVKTYSLARGLISTFQLNNSLLAEHKQLSLLYFQPNRDAVLEAHARAVCDYAAKLKERDRWITEVVGALFVRTNQWLATHPAH
ncbi:MULTISPECIES: hypothetical protein [Burkholderia cepacia complex]|uniref:hypothetical protein n=1 Tax=Burkholderia cepacia complex TaxID=87882 RepID=UPI0015891404|nr:MULTISPECIES: hypothetical protein [Burkholderia cepacia complex]HEM7800219.1 hypothetical protein [Burkholderia cenocepacia]